MLSWELPRTFQMILLPTRQMTVAAKLFQNSTEKVKKQQQHN